MAILSDSDLQTLLEQRQGQHISLYMPTHRAGPEIQQDPIRLRNLVRQAEDAVVARGVRPADAREMLQAAGDLLDQPYLWRHLSDGLALFLARGFFREYRLPFRFADTVVVNDRFYIKPLLPLLSEDGRFYILALSQKKVRLLEGTRFSVAEVPLEDLPKGLAETLQYDVISRHLSYHTSPLSPVGAAPGSSGAGQGIFHTGGSDTDQQTRREDLLRYFHQIDDGVSRFLGEGDAPLVLAGVDYLLPLYREANSYRNILSEGIAGGPDLLSPQELHNKAWPLVQPLFEQERNEGIAMYRQLAGERSVKASRDLSDILPAAYYGRAGTLFVVPTAQRWGRFDTASNVVLVHPAAEAGDDELLDLAAAYTMANRGAVYALDRTGMPDEGDIAAVYRY